MRIATSAAWRSKSNIFVRSSSRSGRLEEEPQRAEPPRRGRGSGGRTEALVA
jgi:hypothetical protein